MWEMHKNTIWDVGDAQKIFGMWDMKLSIWDVGDGFCNCKKNAKIAKYHIFFIRMGHSKQFPAEFLLL